MIKLPKKYLKSIYLVILCLIVFSIDLFLFLQTENSFYAVEHELALPIYSYKKIVSSISDQQPPVKPSNQYTIALVGDSMTDALRSFDENFLKELKNYYPEKQFTILNYGFGATNILSVNDRLENKTDYLGQPFPPLLKEDFDVIIIESMGNNPLSQYKIYEGLEKQTKELDQIVQKIKTAHPNSVIVFMATVAPNKQHYGEGVVELSTTDRERWADERMKYMENHINYAKAHNIPLIDVYSLTLDKDRSGELKFLSSIDHIHLSWEGISLAQNQMANFIYKNRILPL